MEKLKQSIIKHYEEDIKQFIKKELKPNGYIITNKGICKINAFNKAFDMVEIDNIIGLINDHVANYWSVPYEMQKDIVKNSCLELLPMTTKDALDHYLEYVEISNKMIDDKTMSKSLSNLLKENKKRHKKVFKGGYQAPEYQAQALVNNDVFISGKNYYIYKKEDDAFIKLGINNILYYLQQEFDNKIMATPYDIMDYCKVSYPFFVTKSDIPIKYNDNKTYKTKLNDLKKDYAKINKLVRDCT